MVSADSFFFIISAVLLKFENTSS